MADWRLYLRQVLKDTPKESPKESVPPRTASSEPVVPSHVISFDLPGLLQFKETENRAFAKPLLPTYRRKKLAGHNNLLSTVWFCWGIVCKSL